MGMERFWVHSKRVYEGLWGWRGMGLEVGLDGYRKDYRGWRWSV